jgi:DNA adenine methylase
MGNKSRLIKKGLIDKFPKNINKFYDLFAGSCVVALNTSANEYIINDLDSNTYYIYEFFKNNKENYNKVNSKILSIINQYDLPLFSTDSRRKGVTNELRDKYKQHYFKLRDDYNNTKDIYKLLTLQYYAMSRTMRFNSAGDFNMPFGNGYYIEDEYKINYKNLIEFYDKNIKIYNKSYDEIQINNDVNNFVYLDPPYQGATATYNENNKWNQEDDFKLFEFCKALDKRGIKFALSNIYFNKGIENVELKKVVAESNFKEHYFDDFTYCSFGKGNSNTVEVLITNY